MIPGRIGALSHYAGSNEIRAVRNRNLAATGRVVDDGAIEDRVFAFRCPAATLAVRSVD